MNGINQFSALLNDMGRHAGLDLSPDDKGVISLQFEDGILLHICDSGDGVFAMMADTGIEVSSLNPDVRSELMGLFLQINFVTVLASRFSIAQSSEQTIVMTYSDYATRITGLQLLDTLEALVEKTRSLRQLILDMPADARSGTQSNPVSALNYLGRLA